jgi:putative acetyltransferase
MEEFVLRPATNADIPAITNLIKSILPEFGLEYDSHTSDSDILDIEKSYIENGGLFTVAENMNHYIIGTVALYRESDRLCTLRKMYVDKNYRGIGLGKILMERILQKANELNFSEMKLETNAGMTSAIRLYENYGFQKIDGTVPSSPRCNIVMNKKL